MKKFSKKMVSQWKKGWRLELLHEEENEGRQETYEKMLNNINERKPIQVDIRDQSEVWPWREGRAMSLEDGGKGPEPRNVDGEAKEGRDMDSVLEPPERSVAPQAPRF